MGTPVPPSLEAVLGEVTARLASLERQGNTTAADVREAREGVVRLTTIHEEQRVGERLEALNSKIDKHAQEARSDLVNTAAQFGAKVTALDEKIDSTADVLDVKFTGMNDKMHARVAALEKVVTKGEGANALVAWVAKFGPWLLGAVAFALGVKDNLGK